MPIKTFLIKLECDKRTKIWTLNDDGTAELIRYLLQIDIEDFTTGPIPKVTVRSFKRKLLGTVTFKNLPKNA